MIYTESASQTVTVDPDNCIKNYEKPSSTPTGIPSCAVEDSNFDKSVSPPSAAILHERLERRINPTIREDFTTLEKELASWRSREQRKIAALCRDEAHKHTLQRALVEKETHVLRKIEAAKRSRQTDLTQTRLKREWSEESRPLNWKGISVDTPQICRLRTLTALYGELAADVDEITSRIGLLERTRAALECDPGYGKNGLAKDVTSLVSREVCLLQFRDTDLGADALAGLRCRLLNNFSRMLTEHASQARVRRDCGDSP